MALLPGNGSRQMNTISTRTKMNATFKNFQPLPLLANDFVSGRGDVALYPPSVNWPRLHTQDRTTARPAGHAGDQAQRFASGTVLRAAKETAGERIAFGLLGLAALAGLAQAFGTMAELASKWEQFSVWVTRFLG
jgi:hypothetical protein